MYLDWTKHLKTEEDKKEFEQYLVGSPRIFNRLDDILAEYEKSLDRSEVDPKSFDQPNWDYRQAYKNGYRACLMKMKELIKF